VDAESIPGVGHAIGCAASHAAALYRFAGRPGAPDDWLVVMEDDARWGPALPEAWPGIAAAVPPDAEILFVGGDVWKPGGRGERLGPRLTRAAGVVRTHCYAVPRRAAGKAAGIVDSQPGTHCDQLLAFASERGELSVVAADPFLVAQRSDRVTWYAWNPGEPGTTDAGLEAWARDVLGRPPGERVGAAEAGSTAAPPKSAAPASPCRHRSAEPVAAVGCETCGGTVSLKVYGCRVFGTCTIGRKVEGRGCCEGCNKREV
jgi:hypothetical protein